MHGKGRLRTTPSRLPVGSVALVFLKCKKSNSSKKPQLVVNLFACSQVLSVFLVLRLKFCYGIFRYKLKSIRSQMVPARRGGKTPREGPGRPWEEPGESGPALRAMPTLPGEPTPQPSSGGLRTPPKKTVVGSGQPRLHHETGVQSGAARGSP